MNGFCEAGRQLAEQFATAARLYAETVVKLTSMREVPENRFRELCEGSDEALERAERAGAAFEKHVVSHHCGLVSWVRGVNSTNRL